MNKEILKNILKTPSMEFSYEEIQTLLDGELEKPVEEMDTDLVELCIEVLSRKDTVASEQKGTETDCDTKTKSRNKRNVRKIFLIAAVVTLLSLITVSVSANVFSIDVSDGIVTIFGKQISLNLTKNSNEKILDELELQGIEDAYLLPIFYDKNCKLELAENISNDYHMLKFNFSDSEISGYITIRKYDSVKSALENINIHPDVEQIKQINIDGTDVIITSTTAPKALVYYNINENNYKIVFRDLSFDEIVNLFENS